MSCDSIWRFKSIWNGQFCTVSLSLEFGLHTDRLAIAWFLIKDIRGFVAVIGQWPYSEGIFIGVKLWFQSDLYWTLGDASGFWYVVLWFCYVSSEIVDNRLEKRLLVRLVCLRLPVRRRWIFANVSPGDPFCLGYHCHELGVICSEVLEQLHWLLAQNWRGEHSCRLSWRYLGRGGCVAMRIVLS